VPEYVRHCGGCNGFLASWDECAGLSGPDLTAILEAKLMEYARCVFDGKPLHPEDARVIGAFRATLAARAGGAKPGLRWREQMDGYDLEWYCEPPRPRYRFLVSREEWVTENSQPVRRVYEIEEIHGAASSPGQPDSDGRPGPGPGSPGSGQEAPATPA